MSLRGSIQFHRRALAYFQRDWKLLIVWVLLIALSTATGLSMAWPMAILVDAVLAPAVRSDWMHRAVLAVLPSGNVGRIIFLAAASLLLKLLQDWLSTAQSIISNHVSYRGLVRIRCDLYRKLQSLSLAYHHSRPQGDAIYRLTNDTFGCQNILSVVLSTFAAVVTLVVMLFVLGARSWKLTGVAFSIAPFLAWANFYFAGRFNRRTMDCRQVDTRFMTTVQRSMGTIRLVQAFAREEEEFRQFHGAIHETIAAWWRLNREQFAYNLIVGALFGIGSATIFGYGGYIVYRGELSVGDLMVFTSYLGMLWGPLCQLTGFSSSVQSGVASASRVFEILDREPDIADAPGALALPIGRWQLRLDQVRFGYDSAKPVLNDVSVTIEPGEMVAFVGASGVGKSTLLNLLPRFYDPRSGCVRLGGADIRELRLKDLRRNVTFVLQDSVILPTTIAENIAYGRPDATREQITAAAEKAGAAEFIRQLADGFDTVIAEGGVNLSGGQRQRISIARALLTEAPLIVLDEPTSALDSHHERLIADLLSSLKRERTIVLVTHRLSTTIRCDQIFVMEDGRVRERGTYGELIARPGLFQRMAMQQGAGDNLPEAA